MVELRDYQASLLQGVGVALDGNSRSSVMLQLPTGGGKTIIAGGLLKAHLADGRKAVWLTHRKELAQQTRQMLTSVSVSAMADILWKPRTDAPAMSGGVVILMAQTVSRRVGRGIWNQYGEDDLMVIDEAHHATAKGYARAMRQWPGRIVGMTATPWRLSEKEGFDHLFEELICGPQIAELQSDNWLCRAQVRVPSREERILGGEVGSIGDYTEPGIEQANSRDVMTAGTLRFWKEHAEDRQTIVYAVSTDHAHNLAAVFADAGIPARVILGDTSIDERNRTIEEFRDGTLRVLVNVLVATEGFDLPDASCVLLTRPTLSLALFMQMVGRGLRPKGDGGDCIILDLPANTITHGLPEDEREWQLEPRGKEEPGETPVVWCPRCGTVSPAASHSCPNCGESFGKECGRCGKWRAWKRWHHENHCGDSHELVCDYCHRDAHVQARLPIVPPLDELPYFDPEDEMYPQTKIEIDDVLASRLTILIRELLERERRDITSADAARQEELSRSIQMHEATIQDDDALDSMFKEYVDGLPWDQRPKNNPQTSRMFTEWENIIKRELADWQNELATLRNRPIDKRAIFDSARNKLLFLLSREGDDLQLLPTSGNDVSHDGPIVSDDGWVQLASSVPEVLLKGRRPKSLRFPDRREIQVNNWTDLIVEVAEWVLRASKPLDRTIMIGMTRYLINQTPIHQNGTPFGRKRRLSNGLWLEANLRAKQICNQVEKLTEHLETDVQFFVRLS